MWSNKLLLYKTDALAWPRSCKTLHQYGAVLGGGNVALSVLERSLKIFDDNALTDYLISQIWIEKGELGKALDVQYKIANGHGIGFTDFSRFMFLVDHGYVLIALGKISEYPVNLIEEGLEIYGWVPHARNAAAVGYMHLDRYEEAIRHLKKAVEMARYNPILWSNLGVAYWLVGERELAAGCLQNTIEMVSQEEVPEYVRENVKILNGETKGTMRIEVFYERMS